MAARPLDMVNAATDVLSLLRGLPTGRLLAMALCCLAGFVMSWLVILLTIRVCRRRRVAARVRDPHHTHKLFVPRFGGIGLAAGFCAVMSVILLYYEADLELIKHRPVFVLGCLAMFAVGFADDLKPQGATRKLIGQIVVAVLVYLGGFNIEVFKIPVWEHQIHLGHWGLPVTVLWLVGLTNLINLIDGVDGLAGGICLMLMVLLAYMGLESHLGLLAAGMAGALAGFLRFNFPPARIFMGDGGAYFLGFLIAMMTLSNSHKGTVAAALLAPLFVLALPIVDTSIAIIRRSAQGLPIFRPDRGHIHHRLLGMGLPRRKVVIALYVFTLVFLVMGFLVFSSRGRLVPVLVGLALAILLGCAGWLSFSREWFAVGRMLGNSFEMRREIQYALQMAHWLELEAARGGSAESLFSDFTFLLRKLGFSYGKIETKEGHWTWRVTGANREARTSRHDFHSMTSGVLTLGGALCVKENGEKDGGNGRWPSCREHCPCVADGRLYSILSELAAEAWIKAIRRWEARNGVPLSLLAAADSTLVRPEEISTAAEPAIAKQLAKNPALPA